ncbi:FeS cluster assembly protein SufD [bacterium HR36]|nr:FeS cluster assembly protein SufD [bacterium HR36]
MLKTSERTGDLLDNWAAFLRSRSVDEPPSLRRCRQAAAEAFARLGYPLKKNEDWKYTNVSRLAQIVWNPAPPIERISIPDWEAIRTIIANGRVVYRGGVGEWGDKVSIDDWDRACKMHANFLEEHWNQVARWSQHPFAALNTACFQDAVIIRVKAGHEINLPIHILMHHQPSINTGQACFPRILIYLETGSRATVVESYQGGDEASFTCGIVEIILERFAHLDYYKVQQEDEHNIHIVQTYIRLAQGSELRAHIVSLGGGLVRNECDVQLTGEQGVCTLNGLYLAHGRQHVDNHTEIEHVAPGCVSFELYKGILSDRAHGVFHGKIYVHPGAQKTDAKQTNQALLLSDDAEVDSKPQLEIYADDVRCTHGATVGQLDDRQLFYLRTRGISAEQARNLLIYGFAEEIISRIHVAPVRYQLEDLLLAQEGLPLESELRRVILP